MHRMTLVVFIAALTATVLVAPLPQAALAQNTSQYPHMAPLDEYLMPSAAEIALARSAAPASVSKDATVMVLGRQGYETAVKGTNGFVCIVERAWTSPWDSPEFWNPKDRGPICYNPPAVRSILPITYQRTKLAIAGRSKDEMLALTKTAYANKELPALEPGAMCYMMSKQAYLTDQDGHNLSHLMFFAPLDAKWGAGQGNRVVQLGDAGPPQPFALYIVPVLRWSDGTPVQLPR